MANQGLLVVMKSYSDFGIQIHSNRSAGNIKTNCPQCSKDRSDKPLSVDLGRGLWHCFRCSEKGSLGLDKSEWNMTKPVYKKPQLKTGDDSAKAKAYAYLMGRGISKEVLDEARIDGSAYRNKTGELIEAIVFPYIRDGEIVNIKYRRINEKRFSMTPECEQILYGLDQLGDELVVWVEGEVDVLSCRTAGMVSVTSLPTGAKQPNERDSSQRFAPFDAAWAKLQNCGKHVLFTDRKGDLPGLALEAELIVRLGTARCWRADCPPDCKDANDVLMKYGPEILRECIENAKPIPDEGIVDTERIEREVKLLYDGGLPPGVYPGWPNLARLYRPPRGQLTVMTGIPNSGKSNFLDDMMRLINHEEGWRFGIFSPETYPPGRHAAQVIEKQAGIPFAQIERDYMESLLQWYNENFFIIRPKDFSYRTILEMAATLVSKYGIKGLIIDPWNRLEHNHGGDISDIQYLVQVLTALADFAQVHQVHIWLVAHPHKMSYDSEGKIYPPGPYNISGGAHFYNIADFILVVHRDPADYGGLVDVYVKKVRFKENGRCGHVQFKFNPAAGIYSPYEYGKTSERI